MRQLIVPLCISGVVLCTCSLQLAMGAAGCAAGLIGIAAWLLCLVLVWLSWAYRRAILGVLQGKGFRSRLIGWLDPDTADLVRRHLAQMAAMEEQIGQAAVRIRLLERQNCQTEAVLRSIHDAVIVVDQTNKVLLANKAAGQLFGLDPAVVRNQDVERLLGPDGGQVLGLIQQVRLGRNDHARTELSWPGQQGDCFYDCVVSCVRDQQGQACGAVVVLHDLTRDRQLNKAKDDFVGYVSHELKTPLASITAYVEMLLDGEVKDDSARIQFLKVIQDQAARLNQLVEDMLNTSRIESGLIPVKKQAMSLAMLVEQQVRLMNGYARERGITIEGHKPIVYDQVMADRDLIGMAIVNLLSNAIKYNTPGGSVYVRTEVDEAHSAVRLTVTDTGVGIPAEQQARLFEKFYRAPANANRAEGTGLGLSLVKQIVERLHGGRVFFQSQVGVGSTFGFELPLACRTTGQPCRVGAMV